MIDEKPRMQTVEKAHAKLVFQFRQRLGDSAFRHEQRIRGCRHAAMPCNRDENGQLPESDIHRLVFLNPMSKIFRFSK